ncbi:granzyme B-like isoform X4 [Acanthochromis polyacanthus]|uniref:granzyme B-like isoform X4 n=1 Tax=Acanthochromis polyacanthus TaxID=80966 RepID=UPI002233EDCD|nr:granzyme B-like isoform X4 [Acanthochromis polyacanthus]
MMNCIVYFFLLVSFTGASASGIVGGRVSKPHSRPYMASLQFGKHHSCGGILIRKDFVLTAAHCKDQQEMTVVLGAHDITKKEKSQQRIQVAKYYPHPKFNGKHDYDIMLLQLKNNATLNRYVKPIGLPKKNGKVPANVNCTVAGWGRTGADSPASNVLRETTEKMQFSDECKRKWQQYFNSKNMICTKFSKKMGGVCQGDSGGPLICNSKPQGITAFTDPTDCNNPKYPHVFTKVGAFIPWIEKVMQKSGNVA